MSYALTFAAASGLAYAFGHFFYRLGTQPLSLAVLLTMIGMTTHDGILMFSALVLASVIATRRRREENK